MPKKCLESDGDTSSSDHGQKSRSGSVESIVEEANIPTTLPVTPRKRTQKDMGTSSLKKPRATKKISEVSEHCHAYFYHGTIHLQEDWIDMQLASSFQLGGSSVFTARSGTFLRGPEKWKSVTLPKQEVPLSAKRVVAKILDPFTEKEECTLTLIVPASDPMVKTIKKRVLEWNLEDVDEKVVTIKDIRSETGGRSQGWKK